jgi:hypothetical protein
VENLVFGLDLFGTVLGHRHNFLLLRVRLLLRLLNEVRVHFGLALLGGRLVLWQQRRVHHVELAAVHHVLLALVVEVEVRAHIMLLRIVA